MASVARALHVDLPWCLSRDTSGLDGLVHAIGNDGREIYWSHAGDGTGTNAAEDSEYAGGLLLPAPAEARG